ncbi:hypothetical protein F4859DRAFT_356617 [Xylaria cf. heliscus]|nr:hypothetical protein F4859DRAFT_356617 [Xylaria cf. heliscus]
MCTGIIHVYRCQECSAVVYKLREAAPGYTCHQARYNRHRGVCRTGIDYSFYDRISEEDCLFCEVYVGGEVSDLTADNCDEGDDPWPEDREDDTVLTLAEHHCDENREALQGQIEEAEHEEVQEENQQEEDEEDDDDDDEDGGAKLY